MQCNGPTIWVNALKCKTTQGFFLFKYAKGKKKIYLQISISDSVFLWWKNKQNEDLHSSLTALIYFIIHYYRFGGKKTPLKLKESFPLALALTIQWYDLMLLKLKCWQRKCEYSIDFFSLKINLLFAAISSIQFWTYQIVANRKRIILHFKVLNNDFLWSSVQRDEFNYELWTVWIITIIIPLCVLAGVWIYIYQWICKSIQSWIWTKCKAIYKK